MAKLTLSQLFTRATETQFFDLMLLIGRSLGLPVESWIDGDTTKTQYWVNSELLATLESNVRGYIAAGFGSFAVAEDGLYDWLRLWAYEMFGYEAAEAIAAQTTVTLTNSGGALYSVNDLRAGALTFENTTTGATYTNSTGPDGDVPLLPFPGPGNEVTMTVVANEAGTVGNASAGEIALQTGLQGVTAANASAAIGQDRETSASILRGARATLGPISPNGPADAYDSVVTDSRKTGTTAITRSRTYAETTTGDVTVYVAGPAGEVSPEDVTRAEDAVVKWALPQCTTPTVASAVNRTINVTYELWVYNSIGLTGPEIEQAIQAAYEAWFPGRPIGGDLKEGEPSGKVFLEGLKDVIKRTPAIIGHFQDLAVSVPGADVSVTAQEVPVIGTITATEIHLEKPPTV